MFLPIIFTILIFPGMFMALIPMMPAMPYMFLVVLAYGFMDGFEVVTLQDIGIFAGILIISILIDYFAGIVGAKYGGASRKGILFGFLGLVLGVLLLPPFGGFIGLFIGVFIAEFVLKSDAQKAIKAATGSLIGSISGILLNTLLAIIFFILFIIFVFFI
ncbi:MAG: DUF456 domain-containing protein [Parcubacteria group bacterium]|nr:DUF456 domain-containing protein [Parcubacteria group bacterium]